MASSPTKKYGGLAALFGFLSWAVLIGPMAYFIITGFIAGAVVSKVVLGITTVAALIILAISALQKAKLRSPFWIVIIGLSFCLSKVHVLLLIMGGATLLDELIFSPLAAHYRNLHTINYEMDKRLGG